MCLFYTSRKNILVWSLFSLITAEQLNKTFENYTYILEFITKGFTSDNQSAVPCYITGITLPQLLNPEDKYFICTCCTDTASWKDGFK